MNKRILLPLVGVFAGLPVAPAQLIHDFNSGGTSGWSFVYASPAYSSTSGTGLGISGSAPSPAGGSYLSASPGTGYATTGVVTNDHYHSDYGLLYDAWWASAPWVSSVGRLQTTFSLDPGTSYQLTFFRNITTVNSIASNRDFSEAYDIANGSFAPNPNRPGADPFETRTDNYANSAHAGAVSVWTASGLGSGNPFTSSPGNLLTVTNPTYDLINGGWQQITLDFTTSASSGDVTLMMGFYQPSDFILHSGFDGPDANSWAVTPHNDHYLDTPPEYAGTNILYHYNATEQHGFTPLSRWFGATYQETLTYGIDGFTVTQVPEPSSALTLGLSGILGLLRRRRRE